MAKKKKKVIVNPNKRIKTPKKYRYTEDKEFMEKILPDWP